MTDTLATIRPIILRAYGSGPMAEALAEYLAAKIDTYSPDHAGERNSRERMIMLTCWDWMTGGSTAESVAARIATALA